GNPLAVFFNDGRLSDAQMAALAREFGWSEVTFVEPASGSGAAARVRIWTPTGELPFAGHPTVGTTVALARRGLLPASGHGVLELGIGPTPVEVLELDAQGGRARMIQQRPRFGSPLTARSAIAAAFGLAPDDLNPDLAPQVVSTGFPFLMVPLRHPALLARLRPDSLLLPALLHETGAHRPYCFALPTDGGPVRARMLDTDREDAATGSAAGALGAYLVERGVLPFGPVRIAQGEEMGRPGEIFVEVGRDGDGATEVKVSGRVQVWAEGRLTDLPAV
ncbi:MAG: PhzF family phenazine biosynthesis protein, partial [Chloroflexi bacterium]|nr:PhzF family phenazine biosynthesis protein [Chloroflexota bacterium]